MEPKNVRPLDPSGERVRDALIFSHINPEVAIAKADSCQMTNKRASTMLEVARTIAGDYPERAASLIVEMQRRNKPIDDELQLNLISARPLSPLRKTRRTNCHELLPARA